MPQEMDPEQKLQEDVMNAAKEAMKMEAEAGATPDAPVDEKKSAAINDPAATEPENPDVVPESAEETAPAPSAEEKLAAEVEAAKAETAAANDRYVRLMAEFDNFRRRSAKEQLDLIEVANGKLLEKFADVWENFDRAFATENKGDLASFEKGMQMIQTQFVKVLTDAGLEQIDPTGAEFDPNCHEALMQQPSETIPEGHVVTTFQKGYKLKNKILKTAKVIVSSGK